MSWTREQNQAINIRDCNLLVAAAAGSGKTSVLVERILKRILPDNADVKGIDVDRMLIVTFTRAASAEMRERIYSSIQEKMDIGGDSARLFEQQALLGKAHIKTLHAFCSDVIRSNFIESGIDSSFRVADENEIKLLKRDVLDEVAETWYKKKSVNFENLVETYGEKQSDNSFKELILSLYHFALCYPDPEAWIVSSGERFNSDNVSDFGKTIWGQEIISDLVVRVTGMIEELENLENIAQENEIYEYSQSISEDILYVQNILDVCKKGSWEDSYNVFLSPSFNTIKRAKKDADKNVTDSIKKARSRISGALKNISKTVFGGSSDSAISNMKLLYPDMKCLCEVVLDFMHAYKEAKIEQSLLDLNDLEHLALKVLSVPSSDGSFAPSDVGLRYRDKFEEVYVDEYQDTNLLQETILNLVSRGSNLFMVGDVKQSIYGFRQARPDLFVNKYRTYTLVDALNSELSKNKLVRLFTNFRSRKDVVDGVNYVFGRIMNNITCGMDYTKEEYLNYGAQYYDKFSDESDYSCEMNLLQNYENGESLRDEAIMTAGRIKKLFSDKFMVYDKGLNGVRPVQYKDIVILMRATKNNAKKYAEQLNSEGVPAFYEEKGGFFDSYEISVVLSFLKIIDNPLQDIPLLSVLRSPMFNFTDSEIAMIRIKNRNGMFYEACKNYLLPVASEDVPDFISDVKLEEKVRCFLEFLSGFRAVYSNIGTAELVWKIITDTGYYAYVGTISDGAQSNLRMLFENAMAFDDNIGRGMFKFLNYLERLRSRDGDLVTPTMGNESMNVVRIMNIHKSKGLEFPVVFLSGTDKKFSKLDTVPTFIKHKILGFGPSCFEKERKVIYPSIIKESIKSKIDFDTKAEEMRLLYVAMTRARDKLIINGVIKSSADEFYDSCRAKCRYTDNKPGDYNILTAGSYLDWIGMSLAFYENGRMWNFYNYIVDDFLLTFNSVSDTMIKERMKMPDNVEKVSVNSEILNIFEWKYPFPTLAAVPSKLSVSEIKRLKEADPEDGEVRLFSKRVELSGIPDFLKEKVKVISASEKGTLLHACLQNADLEKCRRILQENISDKQKTLTELNKMVEDTVNRMVENEYISKVQGSSIETNSIAVFFASDFAARILASKDVRREVPFTLVVRLGDVYRVTDYPEEKVPVQGVIDCFFEENGKMILVDFKSDTLKDVDPEETALKYKVQLECYSDAIQKLTGYNVTEKYIYYLRSGKPVLIN